MKKLNIAEIEIDQKIGEEVFILKEFERKVSKSDNYYYNVKIGDRSGELRGKVWPEAMNNVETGLSVGDIVILSGIVQEYNGKPQIIISRMRKAVDMAPEEFLDVTSRDRAQIMSVFEEEISNITDPYLKVLLDKFWQNGSLKDKFMNYPAGEYVHHAYIGGLIEHTYEMLEMSRPFFRLYPQLNWDLFFTGLFFHDIGKIEEFDIVGATIMRSSAGKFVAHIGQGLLIVDRLVREIPEFPELLRDKLYHLILSHQGELQYGSPIKPQTLEAMVLSFVDANSAYMNQAVKHIERSLPSGEDFTDYHKYLGRSLWQGDYLAK